MAESSLRTWLRNHLGNTELATEAPKAFDLGLVAGTLGVLLALPIRIKLILKGRSCGIMGLPQPMNQGVSHVDHTPPEPDHANPAHHHH